MGRGLVHPQDDLRASNPASHPELLEELGRLGTIVELVRAIAGSAAYERDGATEANHDDSTAYSHALVKPLPAEVLADAIAQVTGIPYNYPNRPPGTRAIDLGDAAVPSYTLDVCGRGRPDFTGSLAQELHLLNGEAVADRLACVEGLLGLTDADLIEELTLRTLSRPATGKEAARWSALLASGPRQEVAEDLLWALINSWEFRTCH
jgi:hypothetical protein